MHLFICGCGHVCISECQAVFCSNRVEIQELKLAKGGVGERAIETQRGLRLSGYLRGAYFRVHTLFHQ